MSNHENFLKHYFDQHISSIEIERDGDRDITVVNGRRFNNFIVDIGGATLLTAFRELENPESGVLVIDPRTRKLSANLIALIKGGNLEMLPKFFSLHHGDELKEISQQSIEAYAHIFDRIEGLDWKSRLFFQDSFVEDVQSLDLFKVPFADKVLCYYPRPDEDSTMPPNIVIKNGMTILKPTGVMQIVTESMYWIRTAKTFLESEFYDQVNVNLRVMPRIEGKLPLSIYDIEFSQRPRNTIEIRRKISN